MAVDLAVVRRPAAGTGYQDRQRRPPAIGGQRQRLAVARALVARADVVLLDEPTAHLGQDEAAELVADLRRALSGVAVVMVTHDRAMASTADAILTCPLGPHARRFPPERRATGAPVVRWAA
ncbi:ATP-binding cassette domain-containing protein [Arthrobacter sp.]|uniref:ATP-binding cassette domain-containing protein n=1 Tax=Arthrobacter sp. TaxID=1667 RepID=UPI003A8EDB37